jgi:hypothetical protein
MGVETIPWYFCERSENVCSLQRMKRIFEMKKTAYSWLLVIGIMAWTIQAGTQTGEAVLEQQIAKTDSLIMKLLITPEVYRKEITPVDDIFHSLMEQHPEFLTLIRTNAKGDVINVLSKSDSSIVPGLAVAKYTWFSTTKKTLKAYYSPLIKGNEHYSIIWSKPLIVKNTIGRDKFGGAVMVEINIAAFFKQFAVTFREPFKVFHNGKEFFYVAWYDNIPYEDQPISIPGVTGFSFRSLKNRETAKSLMSGTDSAVPQQPAAVAAQSSAKASSTSAAVSSVDLPKSPDNPAPISAFDYFVTNRTLQLYSIAALVILLLLIIVYSNIKKKRNKKNAEPIMTDTIDYKMYHESAAQTSYPPPSMNESSRDAASVNTLRQRIRQQDDHNQTDVLSPFISESSSFILSGNAPEEIEVVPATVAASSASEAPQLKVENTETGLFSNGVTPFRSELVMNENSGVAPQGIDDRVVDALYQEELQKLRRTIYDKLIEKEMPALLKMQKIELAKDIQKRVESLYAAEMEQQERESMRQTIIERLKREEYPALLKEEHERLSGVLPANEDAQGTGSAQTASSSRGLQASQHRQLRSEIHDAITTEYREIITGIEQLSQSMKNVEALRSLSETVRLLTEQQQTQPDFKLDATETESLLHYLKRVQGRLQSEIDTFNTAVHTLVPHIDKIMHTLDEEDRNIV